MLRANTAQYSVLFTLRGPSGVCEVVLHMWVPLPGRAATASKLRRFAPKGAARSGGPGRFERAGKFGIRDRGAGGSFMKSRGPGLGSCTVGGAAAAAARSLCRPLEIPTPTFASFAVLRV